MPSQRDNILNAIKELTAQLAGIPPGPDLAALPNGVAIRFEKTYDDDPRGEPGTGKIRTFLAAKTHDGRNPAWYTTSNCTGRKMDDGELSEFIGGGRCWVLTAATEITVGEGAVGDADGEPF